MSRKNTLEPRWLVSMLTAWVRYCVKSWDSGLGYPSKTPYLADSVQFKNQRTYDGVSLNAYDKEDFDRIELVMRELSHARPELFASVTMYYKPWTINSLVEQGYPFSPNKTYYRRLHDAHEWLAERLQEVERRFLHVEEESII